MKKTLTFCLILLTAISCNNKKNIPDVSNIKIEVKVYRFEQDFFAIDTNRIAESLQQLQRKYHGFTLDYINSILGLDVSGVMNGNSEQVSAVKTFLKDYRPLKDSSDRVFADFNKETKEIKGSLQFVKYYFPHYQIPSNIITFIGPIDAFFQTSFGTEGDIITKAGLGIGLQLHLGSNFSFYKSQQGMEQYPEYISKTFTPEYVVVNCVRNIIDDMYPEKSIGRPLIEQMVEKGKRFYLLDKLLPTTPDYLKMSYTETQMKNTYSNEAVIWNFFLSNEMLNNTEQNIIKNYIGESPKTQELGEDAPGNIGSFTGWQIVKKYMNKNPEITLDKLMNTDAREIYTVSKYKPRS